MSRQKKRRGVRLVFHKPKIVRPKPDCPRCKKGFLIQIEYVEVATEERDEERTEVLYCPRCRWTF